LELAELLMAPSPSSVAATLPKTTEVFTETTELLVEYGAGAVPEDVPKGPTSSVARPTALTSTLIPTPDEAPAVTTPDPGVTVASQAITVGTTRWRGISNFIVIAGCL
jgi:hypothetical protein